MPGGAAHSPSGTLDPDVYMEKLMISVVACDSGPMREQNPRVSHSHAEIDAQALRSSREGPAIVHARVRVGFEYNGCPGKGMPAEFKARVRERTRNRAEILDREGAACAERGQVQGIGGKK
jgi:uncharacterized protein (DUF849 family)